MAHTAHQDPEAMEEIIEDLETLEEHARQLADLIRRSRHFIIFTGAGKNVCGRTRLNKACPQNRCQHQRWDSGFQRTQCAFFFDLIAS